MEVIDAGGIVRRSNRYVGNLAPMAECVSGLSGARRPQCRRRARNDPDALGHAAPAADLGRAARLETGGP
jgi:hypothetical protein